LNFKELEFIVKGGDRLTWMNLTISSN
jgi:hypothetical protein